MSSPDSEPFRLSRRRALAGAAWSAPAIVVASAVPAYAASGDLVLQPGESAAVLNPPDASTQYYDLEFSGLSVLVPSALSAGQLTLNVTYIPDDPLYASMYVLQVPSTWGVSPGLQESSTSILFTYSSAVAAGTEVPMEDGFFVGSGDTASRQTGAYVVTATAGPKSDTVTFVTGEPLPGGGGRAVPRGGAR
jgi:hypothetical protein